eukprot:662185-Rhodomonas_salina.1
MMQPLTMRRQSVDRAERGQRERERDKARARTRDRERGERERESQSKNKRQRERRARPVNTGCIDHCHCQCVALQPPLCCPLLPHTTTLRQPQTNCTDATTNSEETEYG